MKAKNKEKEKAIKLRKQGFSYNEILKQIPVAKSSLSLWLKSVKLARSQKQRLTEKKLISARKGAKKRKEQRITITREIKNKSKKEIGSLSKRDLWLIGIALYWAEGEKEKLYRSGASLRFGNSDPNMIRVFLRWLHIIGIEENNIYFSIYVHENHKNRVPELIDYWSKNTSFSIENFNKVYFKRNKIKTNRKNNGSNYFGLLKLCVKNSSNTNRKVQGWIEGIHK